MDEIIADQTKLNEYIQDIVSQINDPRSDIGTVLNYFINVLSV